MKRVISVSNFSDLILVLIAWIVMFLCLSCTSAAPQAAPQSAPFIQSANQ